jgi:hypothetical protein
MIDFEELHVFDNSKSIYVPREMYEKAYRTWKQAAKYWYSGDGHEQVYELGYADGYSAANDDASGRLELLREAKDRCEMKGWCPFCTMLEVDTFRGHEHAPDCELARELGEQPADTEEFDGGGVA